MLFWSSVHIFFSIESVISCQLCCESLVLSTFEELGRVLTDDELRLRSIRVKGKNMTWTSLTYATEPFLDLEILRFAVSKKWIYFNGCNRVWEPIFDFLDPCANLLLHNWKLQFEKLFYLHCLCATISTLNLHWSKLFKTKTKNASKLNRLVETKIHTNHVLLNKCCKLFKTCSRNLKKLVNHSNIAKLWDIP